MMNTVVKTIGKVVVGTIVVSGISVTAGAVGGLVGGLVSAGCLTNEEIRNGLWEVFNTKTDNNDEIKVEVEVVK